MPQHEITAMNLERSCKVVKNAQENSTISSHMLSKTGAVVLKVLFILVFIKLLE